MKRNIKGFRLNKNGKPIIIEVGEVRFKDFKGSSYKINGTYYFYFRESNGNYIYKP